jgi:hypothetical protein
MHDPVILEQHVYLRHHLTDALHKNVGTHVVKHAQLFQLPSLRLKQSATLIVEKFDHHEH